METAGIAERILRHDRAMTIVGLGLVCLLSWAYLLSGGAMTSSGMEGDGMVGMAGPMAWSASHAALMFVMWTVMMAAMMLPGAAPMVLAVAAVDRGHRRRGLPAVSAAYFVLGYLLVWSAFSLAAVSLQWGAEAAMGVSAMTSGVGVGVGGAILIAVGLYQWTPLKDSCLRHCRSPLEFLTTRWRRGRGGAIRMGVEHGVYCLGCCWALMALLFVGGVMNLLWIAAIAGFVLVEKTAPAGRRVGRWAGAVLAALGVWMLLVAF
ncbi:DUF2182 domain-containing protein [Inquilinus sp. CAU 1745]|uniref:DUF2182 domain-containing protein n=1 Tax=Inquilinus sp. CAU 1745 TaxID=3140369 RepID=UPI00325AAC6B